MEDIESLKCKAHNEYDCFFCLKRAVRDVLYYSYSNGNGGFNSSFGVVTFSRLLKLTGHDIEDRHITKVIAEKEKNNE